MNLKENVDRYIYRDNKNRVINRYDKFPILVLEESVHENEVRSYPRSEEERLFAVCWDLHDSEVLSATVIPSEEPFTFEKHFTPGARTLMHSHEYLEFFYIVDGEYHQRILGQEYVFRKGELCLIDKNCLHQELLLGDATTVLFFGIPNNMFDDIMNRQIADDKVNSFLHMALLEQKSLQQYLHFLPRDEQAVDLLEDSIALLLQELSRNDLASPIISQGLLLRIFKTLSDSYEFSLSRQTRQRMNLARFDEITAFMEANLSHMSIGLLCQEFHFQEDYFNRLMKSRTELTYTEYLQLLRLRKAERLLMDTDDTIDQIVEAVGYKNKGYFYKIFLEKHQLTPAQFRKKMR